MSRRRQEKWVDADHGKAFDKWFSSQSSLYGKNGRRSFVRFLEFLKETQDLDLNSDSLLARHRENRRSSDSDRRFEIDDLVPQWHKWLMKKYGVSNNSAYSRVNNIQGFFLFFREPLELKKGLVREEMPERYHIFSHDELCRMFDLGDLSEKAVLCLGVNLGLRIEDFIHLKRSLLIEAKKQQSFPLEFQVQTSKEKILAVCHVTEETWDILNDFWATKSSSEWVFPALDGSFPVSDDKVEDVLKRLWSRAYPHSQEKVRWHNLRKYLLSALGNCGVNHVHTLRMIGKKVESSIATYLVSMDLKKDFRAVESLIILGASRSNVSSEVEGLKKDVEGMKLELASRDSMVKELSVKVVTLYRYLNLYETGFELDVGTGKSHSLKITTGEPPET